MNKRLETALYTTRSPNDQEAHEELLNIVTHDRNTKETATETLTDTHSHMRARTHACVHADTPMTKMKQPCRDWKMVQPLWKTVGSFI